MNAATARTVAVRVGSSLALLAVVIGAPLALRVGGSPFGGHLPSWSHALADLHVGYVPSGTLSRVAFDAGWFAWLFLTYEIAAESWSVLRRQVSRRSSVLGPLHPLLAKLVATVVFSLPLLGAKPALRPAMATVAGAVARPYVSSASSGMAASLPIYTVRRHDTLWGIAHRYLGDPLRWTEIARLNADRLEGSERLTDPHWIDPGWELVLPADASGLPPSTSPNPAVRPPQESTLPAHGSAAARRDPQSETRRAETPSSEVGPVTPGTVTPSTEIRPPHAAGPPDTAQPRANEPNRSPLAPIGLGVLGVGIVGLLARARRVQQRHRRSGRRIPLPTGELAAVEQRLASPLGGSAVAFLDGAIRLLSRELRASESVPTILGAVLGDEQLEVLLATDAPAPPSFTNGAPDRWLLSRDGSVDLALGDASGTIAALPCLVTVGQDEDGLVLLNLAAGGTIALEGDPTVAGEIATAIALELAGAPWSETLELIDVGIGNERAGRERCITFECVDDALPRLRAHVAAVSAGLAELNTRDVGLGALAEPSGAWSPCALIVDGPSSATASVALGELAVDAIPNALTVVMPGTWSAAHWHLIVRADGTLEIPPLGRSVCAQRVSRSHLAGIAALLGLAARQDDVPPSSAPYDRIEVSVDEASPEVSVPIDVPLIFPMEGTEEPAEDPNLAPASDLEPPAVATRTVEVDVIGFVRCDGLLRDPDRAKSVELIVWLALHPGEASNDLVSTALWPNSSYSERTLWNRISDARRALGNGPDGKPLLERVSGLQLSRTVTSDWSRFRQFAASADPDQRARALDLVRGQPFAGVDWPWATIDGFIASIEAEVTDLAEDVAEQALLRGDAPQATHAAEQGILVSPYDERLYRILMRAGDAVGNPAAIRSAMQRLAAVLEADVEPLESVHPETRLLYEALMQRRRREPRAREQENIAARRLA